jgi:ribonuclease P protein component
MGTQSSDHCTGSGLQLMEQVPVIGPPGEGTMRFSRHSRLLKPADFKQVFQQPFRSGDHCFRVLSRFNDTQCHRLGMAVAKKSCPKAVARNRIKRIVRENFRTQLAGLRTAQALDFVILPTAQAAKQSNQALGDSLSRQWRKLIEKAAQASSARASSSQTSSAQAAPAQPVKRK